MGNIPSGTIWSVILSWSTYRSIDLPSLNADPDSITMSGLSGGSWYSTNMHVSNSLRIKGVGLFSGGAYGSLKSSADLYPPEEKVEKTITDFDAYYTANEATADATPWIAIANENAANEKIDPLSNLNGKPVFISSNKLDWVVPSYMQYEQKKFYEAYSANVLF